MRVVVFDPAIAAPWLRDEGEWLTPLEAQPGRWAAFTQGYIALVAEGQAPEPDAFVVQLRLPHGLEDCWGLEERYNPNH